MKIFISGSISIKKLPEFAIEKLDNIIKKEYSVLIGDAKGADSIVQKYLKKKNYKNVVVYYAGKKIRNNFGNWNTNQILSKNNEKGRQLYTLKDIEMANDADFGLMIWDGKSEGTLNNISMMKSKNKRFLVIIEETIADEKLVESVLEIKSAQTGYEKSQIELF